METMVCSQTSGKVKIWDEATKMQKGQQIIAIVVQVRLKRGCPANPDHFVLTLHTSEDSSGFEKGIIHCHA